MLSISKIWNESIEQREDKPVEKRDRLWASELGKADIDIYYKLIGEQPSNKPDLRSKRKFEAGNLFEWIVKLVLLRCGIYKESQKWVVNNEFGLSVTGKVDHLVGGKINYEKAKKELENLLLPDFFTKATEKILNHFIEIYPNSVPEQGVEVKSVASFGIEKVYFTGKAIQEHDLQAFHYAYNTKLPFTILYICRDDLRMAEIPVMPDNKNLLDRYSNKIKRVSEYYKNNTIPPKEPEIVWDEDTQRFSKNFNVEYSQYLTKIYGYQTPQEYDEKISPKVESWNRVITRIKDNKEMTDNNKEKIEEMTSLGFNVYQLLKLQ